MWSRLINMLAASPAARRLTCCYPPLLPFSRRALPRPLPVASPPLLSRFQLARFD